MKKVLLAALIALGAAHAQAGVAVGVSVNVGDPNFYGAIDVGNYPPPQLLAPAPVVIQPGPVGVVVAPLYLHVPAAHYANWRRYCGIYNACGRPVYFVHDNWYRNVYAPRYHSLHPVGPGPGMHGEVRHEEIRHEEHHEQEIRHDEHHDHDHG